MVAVSSAITFPYRQIDRRHTDDRGMYILNQCLQGASCKCASPFDHLTQARSWLLLTQVHAHGCHLRELSRARAYAVALHRWLYLTGAVGEGTQFRPDTSSSTRLVSRQAKPELHRSPRYGVEPLHAQCASCRPRANLPS